MNDLKVLSIEDYRYRCLKNFRGFLQELCGRYTQRQIAYRIGVDHSTVWWWLRGREPSLKKALELVDAYAKELD